MKNKLNKIEMRYHGICLLFIFLVFFAACKKENEVEKLTPAPGQALNLNLNYQVDHASFNMNQMVYVSAANCLYSVSKLNYYLSQIRLIRPDSSYVILKNYHYADAAIAETNRISLTNIPSGDYIGLAFNIGLDSIQNTSAALLPNNENLNMQWPEPMGGGYHFLRLEGSYKDSTGIHGYAMHLGTNKCLIKISFFRKFSVMDNSTQTLNMVMNINDWFRSPHKFDFNKDGNYIMGNDAAMIKIAENGKTVFKL